MICFSCTRNCTFKRLGNLSWITYCQKLHLLKLHPSGLFHFMSFKSVLFLNSNFVSFFCRGLWAISYLCPVCKLLSWMLAFKMKILKKPSHVCGWGRACSPKILPPPPGSSDAPLLEKATVLTMPHVLNVPTLSMTRRADARKTAPKSNFIPQDKTTDCHCSVFFTWNDLDGMSQNGIQPEGWQFH